VITDWGAQGLETAVDRCARILLITLGVRDLPGDVPHRARGLGNCREFGNIGHRSKRFD
jgi:hypothetical protein